MSTRCGVMSTAFPTHSCVPTLSHALQPLAPSLPVPACAVPLCSTAQTGCRLVGDEQRDAADLWLINTCTVKSPSQSAMDTLLRKGRQAGKALLVAGCVPQASGRGPPQP